ncbi:MAG: hypothetical protein J07HQW2_00388 [Haloquadratum walsbyi J07HQW2]|uniref:Uncharacterized protein n=1 Tax=Haloquadratum walsbyi J07HQW2 TaxID=1238425 RepID=U1MUF4_9EURY|nr:MAG: hypothetical protein J07HQW2_00388 [Haloquadratum walsbyi J07HQW2]
METNHINHPCLRALAARHYTYQAVAPSGDRLEQSDGGIQYNTVQTYPHL